MECTGKEIYRRFWISNQIFNSSYGSQNKAHSLDNTVAVFGKNLNFVDDYLKNCKRFWHAVFARCSILISFTFWTSLIKIVRVIFEKKSKNCHFDHIFGLFGWSNFFGWSGHVIFFLLSISKIMQSFKKIVRAVFEIIGSLLMITGVIMGGQPIDVSLRKTLGTLSIFVLWR